MNTTKELGSYLLATVLCVVAFILLVALCLQGVYRFTTATVRSELKWLSYDNDSQDEISKNFFWTSIGLMAIAVVVVIFRAEVLTLLVLPGAFGK